MQFLHLRFANRETANAELWRMISNVLPFSDDLIIRLLMDEFGWRGRLTAGVFCGLARKKQWFERVGEELVRSRGPYSGPGLVFAMIRYGPDSLPYLRAYLEKWLPRTDCEYDQYWVMAALILLDEENGTGFSSEFLCQGGRWAKFEAIRKDPDGLEEHLETLRDACVSAEMILNLPSGGIPPLLRKTPLPLTNLVIEAQSGIVRFLYRVGIRGQSRFFPLLHRFARRYPLGYQIESYDDWVKGGARKAAWWEK